MLLAGTDTNHTIATLLEWNTADIIKHPKSWAHCRKKQCLSTELLTEDGLIGTHYLKYGRLWSRRLLAYILHFRVYCLRESAQDVKINGYNNNNANTQVMDKSGEIPRVVRVIKETLRVDFVWNLQAGGVCPRIQCSKWDGSSKFSAQVWLDIAGRSRNEDLNMFETAGLQFIKQILRRSLLFLIHHQLSLWFKTSIVLVLF